MAKSADIPAGKCPVQGCDAEGVPLYYNPQTGRAECFDHANPNPTFGQLVTGFLDIFGIKLGDGQ